jgi:hypothetical protein
MSSSILDRLRSICLALPEAREKLSHGSPCWFAGKGKQFAAFDDHHHGVDHVAVWMPQPPGMQEMLVDEAPEVFFRPPYVGHRGWVGMRLDLDPDWGKVAELLQLGFRHVATKKLVAQLDGSEEA